MSGDLTVADRVAGAVKALEDLPGLRLILVGDPAVLTPLVTSVAPRLRARLHLQPATQVVAMDDTPRSAVRHGKDSSMRVAVDLVKHHPNSSESEIRALLDTHGQRPDVNWWILGGSIVFVGFSVSLGLSDIPLNEEIIFGGSLAIVLFLMWRLIRELDAQARNTLIGTALLIFIYRAMPTPGAGSTWWMIDVLGFDQQFLSVLGLIASALTLAGLFIFRRFMAERSIVYVIGVLTVTGTVLALPQLAMFYGFHHWTATVTHGLVDARFISLVDTALESPLGQIAMVPMLAWIANSAPDRLKATYFAVMASFTNLALALSQLGTKYLNDLFVLTREVMDSASGAVQTPANYAELGHLYLAVIAIGFSLPMLAILFVRATRFRSA